MQVTSTPVNEIPRGADRKQMKRAAVRRRYVDGRWGQIHLHIATPSNPTARPVVCFHLSPGSGRMFEAFLGEIGHDRIACAPDTAGYGGSDPPPEPPALEDYADALGDALDALGFGEVDLVGAHTGSRLAVELAHQRPDQVRGLALLGAAVYTEEERAHQKVAFGPAPVEADGGHLASKWTGWASWRWPGVSDEMIGRYAADSVRDFERNWWAHRAVFEHDMAARLAALDQPVLVLCARDDIWEPTLRARRHIKNGRFVELPDWGHWLWEVKTAEIAAMIRGFFDGGNAAAVV